MPYREAFDLQYAIHAAQTRENGRVGEGILLVEHPPVITLGRRSAPGDLLVPREALERQGIEIAPTDRGGQMTWHGPGQIVAYPLISLQAARMGLHPYVRGLEQAVIETLAEFGVEAGRIQGLTGVWVGEEKICAIGLRISRWWSLHGLALNICPDLRAFGFFVPCGITDRGVTSLEKLLGHKVEVDKVKPALLRHLARQLGLRLERRLTRDDLLAALERPAVSETPSDKAPALFFIPSPADSEANPGPSGDDWAGIGPGAGVVALRGGTSAKESLLEGYRSSRKLPVWGAPVGEGEACKDTLLFAALLPPPVLAEEEKDLAGEWRLLPAGACLRAALGIVESWEAFCPVKPMIRWPDEILVRDQTVLRLRANDIPQDNDRSLYYIEIEDFASSIARCGCADLIPPELRPRLALAAARGLWRLWTEPGPLYCRRLAVRCQTLGRSVCLSTPGSPEGSVQQTGLAVGIAPDGALEFQAAAGRIQRVEWGRAQEQANI